MMPKTGVTDDQLGKFYRKIKAMSERLGKPISFNDVTRALQDIHDGTFRAGLNTSEDLQALLQRPVSSLKSLKLVSKKYIFAVGGKETCKIFRNKRRYVNVNLDSAHCLCRLPNEQDGVDEYTAAVFKLKGNSNMVRIAAELLGVPNETPIQWLKKLLVARGCVLTLPAVESLIDNQTEGVNVGLANYDKKIVPRLSAHQCLHMAFVETVPGIIELVYFSRVKPKQWKISRYPFEHLGIVNYDFSEYRLVVRKLADFWID